MPKPKFYNYAGFGQWAKKNVHYSQAVRVGDALMCSGQGGWDGHNTNEDFDFDPFCDPDLEKEIDKAFENCDIALKTCGGKGFSQVYKIFTYSLDIRAQHDRIVYNLRKWMPHHQPIWTEMGVNQLGHPEMRIEIDVEAYDPPGEDVDCIPEEKKEN